VAFAHLSLAWRISVIPEIRVLTVQLVATMWWVCFLFVLCVFVFFVVGLCFFVGAGAVFLVFWFVFLCLVVFFFFCFVLFVVFFVDPPCGELMCSGFDFRKLSIRVTLLILFPFQDVD